MARKRPKFTFLPPLLVIILSLTAIIFLGYQVAVAWPSWGGTKTTGYPVDTGETRDVYDANDTCHKVTNNSSQNIFVPTKTMAEWNAFDSNKPTGVSIGSCCNSHDHQACYNNDVYWYDSCGNREEKAEECGAGGCSGGSCVNSGVWVNDGISCTNPFLPWCTTCPSLPVGQTCTLGAYCQCVINNAPCYPTYYVVHCE